MFDSNETFETKEIVAINFNQDKMEMLEYIRQKWQILNHFHDN